MGLIYKKKLRKMHLRKCYKRVTNSFINFLKTIHNSLVNL